MSIFSPQPRRLLRVPIPKLSEVKDPIPRGEIAQIKKILTRDGDLDVVRQQMISRFATALGEEKNDETGTTTTTLTKITNAALADAFNYGIYEVTRSFGFDLLCSYNARLFPWSRYEYSKDGLESEMTKARKRGGYPLALQVADTSAYGCGSSLVHTNTEGDNLCYDDVYIDEFYYAFASEIIEEGGSRRPVNTTRLDEASVVAMRLEKTGEKARWAAWFGATEEMPNGRYVSYEGDHWHEVPELGAPEANEWTPAGKWEKGSRETANPLTLQANKSKVAEVPTYPFIILRGDPKGRGTLLPTTGVSLYETMLELDIAASIQLRAANDGAIGQQALTRSLDGGQEIPRTLNDKKVILNREQTIVNIGWSPEYALKAQELLLNDLRQVAEAHDVPGFLMVTDWAAFPSGLALRQAEQKMNHYRDKRIQLNESSVDRQWKIERALIEMSGDKVGDVEQTWIPGEVPWPMEMRERVEVAKLRNEMGVDTFMETLRDLKGFDTIEQAVAYAKDVMDDEDAKAIADALKPKAAAPAGSGFGIGAKLQQNRTGFGKPGVPQGGEPEQTTGPKPEQG